MKKITAYVNTTRIHWLVEKLDTVGIKEIMVTEYFSPRSNISRMELFAHNGEVETVRKIIHQYGTTGKPADHGIFVEDHDPSLPGMIPLGRRTSKLEEIHVKQLVNFLLRGAHQKIRAAFLVLTASVLVVGFFVYERSLFLRQAVKAGMVRSQLLTHAASTVESALLEEMLAVERFHRGEALDAINDFQNARAKLSYASSTLQKSEHVKKPVLDSLRTLEHNFHVISAGMFELVDSLSRYEHSTYPADTTALTVAHNQVMAALDRLRTQLSALLSSLVSDAKEYTANEQHRMEQMIDEIRNSLVLLSLGIILTTAIMWAYINKKVALPLRRLQEGARVIDTTELQ